MNQIKKLILPELSELILFLVIGLGSVILLNLKNFWMLLSGDTTTYIVNTGKSKGFIGSWLINLQNHINPRLVDFIVWLLIGCLVFVMLSLVISALKNAGDEAELLHYYRSPVGKRHEMVVYLTKIAIRLVGFLGFIFWFIVFIELIGSWLAGLFFTSATSLNNISSWVWLFMSTVISSLCIYLFAILSRLIILKPRVITTDQE